MVVYFEYEVFKVCGDGVILFDFDDLLLYIVVVIENDVVVVEEF